MSRMKGELHPPKNLSYDFGTLCLLSSLWMTAPMSYFVWGGHEGGGGGGGGLGSKKHLGRYITLKKK